MIRLTRATALLFAGASLCAAANLANPLLPLPAARLAVGGSYHFGSHTITNWEIPSLMNRLHARVTYSPIPFFDIGAEAGATQVNVASETRTTPSDTVTTGIFDGKYGFSFGVHMKAATPLLKGIIGGLVAATGTRFSSENADGAFYGGMDIAVAGGLLFHIPKVGYIACGPKLYVIQGENRSYNSTRSQDYSNLNNLRGWIAFEYFPKVPLVANTRPYVSFEMSIGPDADAGGPTHLTGVSFSIAVGALTHRLYGEATGAGWEP